MLSGLGGFLESDLGRVSQRVEYAQQKVRRNVFRIVVHYGRNAGSGGLRQSRYLTMRQALPLNDLDNLGVQMAAQLDFRASGSD